MKLFDLLRDKIKDPKGVISDHEICAINRRDFIYSETSPGQSFMAMFGGSRASYELNSIIDFIYASVCRIRDTSDVHVYQLSQSMTLPALAISVFVGDEANTVRVCAPRGTQRFAQSDAFAADVAQRFHAQCHAGLELGDIGQHGNTVDILLCNASNEAEVSSALKAFENVRRGFLVIKGYGRIDAPNCGEIILSARLHVHCSLAGFGFCAAY